MPKTIFVLGITGTQGGSVAQYFLTQGWIVRGVTRNTNSAAATALKEKGIELIVADLGDAEFLNGVFAGAEVVFAVTDFWQPFFERYEELKGVSDRATGEYAFQIELQRGKNIVDAAAKALAEEGRLELFIWSTLPGMKKLSGGKYTYIYHFDAKAAVTEYIQQEKRELWKRTSLLNMGFYTTNMVKYGSLTGAVKDQEAGKFILNKPGGNTALHPYVVPTDTGKFADLLVRNPPGINLLACNEVVSYETFIKLWSEVTGVPSVVKEISVDDADQAAPGGLAREAAESTACSAEFGWGQREGTLKLPWEIDPDIELTSLRECFKSEDWTSFLDRK